MQSQLGRAAMQPDWREWRIEQFGGLDYQTAASQIAPARSPDMQNLLVDAAGGLCRRNGWQRCFETPQSGLGLRFLAWFEPGQHFLFANLLAGQPRLYGWREGEAPWLIAQGLPLPKASFVMNDSLWLLTGAGYYRYDGAALQRVYQQAVYTPLLYRGVNGSLAGGQMVEGYNLLSDRYRMIYHADGQRVSFPLPPAYPAAEILSCRHLGQTLAAGFSLSPDGCNIYFDSAPAAGEDALELELRVAKDAAYLRRINQVEGCTFCAVFGGSNDTRVFISGHSGFGQMDWHSGLYDPTYFPADRYARIGGGDDPIVGYSLQYDTMIIHKRNSTWSRRCELSEGQSLFPVRPVSDEVGTVSGASIQIIANRPTMLSKNGVYQLLGGQVRDERNMQHISARIDRRLLAEPNLEQAISFAYRGYYGLAVNHSIYLYEAASGEWFSWCGVPAACFLNRQGRLYFGHREQGLICRFGEDGEAGAESDEGRPIAAYWQSKEHDLGHPALLKTVWRLLLTLAGQSAAGERLGLAVSYRGDRSPSRRLPRCVWRGSSFGGWDFRDFSFLSPAGPGPRVFVRRLRAKRLRFFSLRLQQLEDGAFPAIQQLAVQYQVEKAQAR